MSIFSVNMYIASTTARAWDQINLCFAIHFYLELTFIIIFFIDIEVLRSYIIYNTI